MLSTLYGLVNDVLEARAAPARGRVRRMRLQHSGVKGQDEVLRSVAPRRRASLSFCMINS